MSSFLKNKIHSDIKFSHIKKSMFVCQCKKYGYLQSIVFEVLPVRSNHRFKERSFSIQMNYPAASKGLSIGIFIIAQRGGELNPCGLKKERLMGI
jgi:hypothetical protein